MRWGGAGEAVGWVLWVLWVVVSEVGLVGWVLDRVGWADRSGVVRGGVEWMGNDLGNWKTEKEWILRKNVAWCDSNQIPS